VLSGALVRVRSVALIGGPATTTTNERGQLRFPVLVPGSYEVDIELLGFTPYHEKDIWACSIMRREQAFDRAITFDNEIARQLLVTSIGFAFK
jgi:hypothetical protein